MKIDMWTDAIREAYAASYKFDKLPGYKTIEDLGFEYTGAHGRGGGMGYDIWQEFYHPKYGTLCYVASDVTDGLLGFCGNWYLIPGREWQELDWSKEFSTIPVSGQSLDELLQYLKERDEQPDRPSSTAKQAE